MKFGSLVSGLYCILILLTLGACVSNTSPSSEIGDQVGSQSDYKTISDQENTLDNEYNVQDRLAWQRPNQVIDLLGDISDKTIADIGAGTGYFTFRLARYAKRVIAIDIDTFAIHHIDSTLQSLEENVKNRIETRLALADNPKLIQGEADVVVLVNTYAFIQDGEAYLNTLYELMESGNQLLIVDFKKKRIPIGPPASIKVTLAEIENQLHSAGFKLLKSDDRMLDYQYLVLATKK